MTRQVGLSWFREGDMVQVGPVSEHRSLLFRITPEQFETMRDMLADLDIDPAGFPISHAPATSLARLTAPPRLVDLVEMTLDALRAPEVAGPVITVRRGTEVTQVPLNREPTR
ncbi:MAG: hypothetical protein ACXIU7_05120 [Roseinatronobacter sp.]